MKTCINCKHYENDYYYVSGICRNRKNPLRGHEINNGTFLPHGIPNPHEFGCTLFEDSEKIQVYIMEFKDATDPAPPSTLKLMEYDNVDNLHYVCHAGKIPVYTVDRRAIGKLSDREEVEFFDHVLSVECDCDMCKAMRKWLC